METTLPQDLIAAALPPDDARAIAKEAYIYAYPMWWKATGSTTPIGYCRGIPSTGAAQQIGEHGPVVHAGRYGGADAEF
jgi:hypothetical protein